MLELQRVHRRGTFLVTIENTTCRTPAISPGSQDTRRIVPFVTAFRTMPTNIDEIRRSLPWRRRVMVGRNAKRADQYASHKLFLSVVFNSWPTLTYRSSDGSFFT